MTRVLSLQKYKAGQECDKVLCCLVQIMLVGKVIIEFFSHWLGWGKTMVSVAFAEMSGKNSVKQKCIQFLCIA